MIRKRQLHSRGVKRCESQGAVILCKTEGNSFTLSSVGVQNIVGVGKDLKPAKKCPREDNPVLDMKILMSQKQHHCVISL